MTKTICILVVAMLLNVAGVFAQDLIEKCTGEKIIGFVQEIGNYEVTYKLYDKPDGETKILKKNLIYSIVFSNGDREMLNCQDITELKQFEPPQEEQQLSVTQPFEETQFAFDIVPEQPQIQYYPVETVLQSEYQSIQDNQTEEYQRSSLAMIIFSKDNMSIMLKSDEQKDLAYIRNEVVKSWHAYPFPDKYNYHNIPTKDLNLSTTTTTFAALAYLNKKEKNRVNDAKFLIPKIQQQLKQHKVAHQLVRTWFSSKDGKMWNMEHIKEMGLYNASEGDLNYNIAKNSVRGMAMLEDAGENLINNTFVTVTELIFCSNEPLAAAWNNIGNSIATQINNTNTTAENLVYSVLALGSYTTGNAIRDGYSVFFKTFLFKLKWDKEIEAKFYSIWENEAAFDKMDFDLEYVGYHYNSGQVKAGIFNKVENRAVEVVLNKALVRTLDASFATLQYEHDVFKPIVPIYSINPFLTAKIGMKEGLEGGETFAIMEKTEDPGTHKTQWEKVGTTKVDKNLVWDNRYNAGDEPNKVVIGKDGVPIKSTTFASTGSAQEGLFLKQIMEKKPKKKR